MCENRKNAERAGVKARPENSAGVVAPTKKGRKNGRPSKKGYTLAQLEIIEAAGKNGAGYNKIANRYPGHGFTNEGAKSAPQRLKMNGKVTRANGSGRSPSNGLRDARLR